MFVILPLLFLVLAALLLHSRVGDSAPSHWRTAALLGSVFWGVFLTASTELLSAASSLTQGWLIALWGCGDLALLAILLASPSPRPKISLHLAPSFATLALLCIALIAATTLLIALLAPPNTWDSLTYHMGRVVHWAQNRSVAFYPTAILRQLHQNPGAEFAILHLQILSGGDRFANLVQWFSVLGSVVAVSLIAERLGASKNGQLLAALVAATIPMGILQATSTQNDYVTGFWLASFVYFSMLQRDQPSLVHAAATGGSLGLAILTKATAYVYAFPFLLWLCISQLRALRLKCWRYLLIIAVIVLSANLGHYARNLGLYGSPLGPGAEGPDGQYVNGIFSVSAGVSNVVRNLALHASTPIGAVNTVVERAVALLHAMLRIDINDPRTTWGSNTFHVPSIWLYEDLAGAPLHIALFLASLAAVFVSERLRHARGLPSYAAAATAAFLLFCVVLKWQPWHSRLHLPLFVLWSPLIGVVLSSLPDRRPMYSVAAILAIVAVPYLVHNPTRPLIGRRSVFMSRLDQYFFNNPALRDPYVEAASYLAAQPECSRIGLILGGDAAEYPLWVLLQAPGKKLQLEHVNVTNVSSATAKPFNPCAIISTESTGDATETVSGSVYHRVWSSGPLSVFEVVPDDAGGGQAGAPGPGA